MCYRRYEVSSGKGAVIQTEIVVLIDKSVCVCVRRERFR